MHYELDEDLGEGGFGIVKSVKLLEPGKKLLSANGETNIELAAKIVRQHNLGVFRQQKFVHNYACLWSTQLSIAIFRSLI